MQSNSFKSQYRLASIASYNNHIGVAYTICNSSPEDNWLVLEMGMNHAGELRQLSTVGAPNIVVITSSAPVHMEHFNSVDEIAQAKLEILTGLKENGTLILNADDQILQKNFNKWCDKNTKPSILSYGTSEKSELQILSSSSCGLDGYIAEYKYQNKTSSHQLNTLGQHNVHNTAAAILACRSLILELSLNTIKEGLKTFTPEKHRLSVVNLTDGRKILDDSYNANPTATIKAIDLLADLKTSEQTTAVVLGDMAEIGKSSAKEHRKVAKHLITTNPKFVVTVGNEARLISDYVGECNIPAKHFDTPEDAGTYVAKQEFDILLVKASRSAGLDRCVKKIQELA